MINLVNINIGIIIYIYKQEHVKSDIPKKCTKGVII